VILVEDIPNPTLPEELKKKKKTEQFRTSDFHPTIQVLEEIGLELQAADNFLIMLHSNPLEVAQPYLSCLRGMWFKARPIATELQYKPIDECFDYLQERIYNQEKFADYTRMTRQEVDREILDGLPKLHQDLLMMMSQLGLWMPTTMYRDPQTKKNEYFRVKSPNADTD